jgi:hypothetical protein
MGGSPIAPGPDEFDYRPLQVVRAAGTFGRVFPQDSDSRFGLRLARLLVLFSDLQVEYLGFGTTMELAPLDVISASYRRLYFIRRAIGTAVEFDEALNLLKLLPELLELEGKAQEQDDPHYTNAWLASTAFFNNERRRLKQLRNDVGGHFGEKAIENAFGAMSPDDEVELEIMADARKRVRPRFIVATTLAGRAALKHMSATSEGARFGELVDLLQNFVTHATKVVHFLTSKWLLPRMELTKSAGPTGVVR